MAIQHANRGIVKKDLQLYYNREFSKSFRGEAATNYVGALTANHESATAYWVSTVTKDTSTGYTAFKVVPLAGGYQFAAGVWASCGIIAGNGGFQAPGVYSLSAKVLLPKDSVYTFGFRAYPSTEEFAVDATGTGTWQTIKRENFTSTGYNFLQFQMVRRINGSTGTNSPIFPGDPFWVRDIMINSGSYAKPFASMTNELSARPENTTNITTNGNFASAISGTDSGGTQNGWAFGSWSGSGNSYVTQGSTAIYSSTTTSLSVIPLRVTRTSAGSMDFFSTTWNTLTNGTVYTISFWARSSVDTVTLDIVHQNLGTIKSYAVYTGWYKYTGKFIHAGGTQYPFLRHNGLNGTWIEIANVQLEAKSFPTDFTTTNRTNIQNTVVGGGGLLDLSGNNVNADLTNVSFNSAGYYLAGSASANRIQFTTPTSFIYSAAGKTVLMWIKYTSSSYTGFCGLGNAANGQSFNLRSVNTYLGFMGYNADYDPGVGPQLNNDVWHLIGATFDTYGAGTLKLYVDGVNIASTTLTLNTAPEASNIGYIGRSSHGFGNEGYFGGQAAQFMMYNRALSDAEILQIFNSQRKTYGI